MTATSLDPALAHWTTPAARWHAQRADAATKAAERLPAKRRQRLLRRPASELYSALCCPAGRPPPGRAPRQAKNSPRRRTNGSGTSSSGEGGDDPPSSKPCPEQGCSNPIYKRARQGPWPDRCEACKLARDAERNRTKRAAKPSPCARLGHRAKRNGKPVPIEFGDCDFCGKAVRPARPAHRVKRIRYGDSTGRASWDEAPPEVYRLMWADEVEELAAAWDAGDTPESERHRRQEWQRRAWSPDRVVLDDEADAAADAAADEAAQDAEIGYCEGCLGYVRVKLDEDPDADPDFRVCADCGSLPERPCRCEAPQLGHPEFVDGYCSGCDRVVPHEVWIAHQESLAISAQLCGVSVADVLRYRRIIEIAPDLRALDLDQAEQEIKRRELETAEDAEIAHTGADRRAAA